MPKLKKEQKKEKLKKVTAHLPEELLRKAMEYTKEGTTETLRRALTQLAANPAYEALMKMRGKVKFSLTAEELKELRD